ncbi:MAG: amino acid racemase [Rhodobacteraceae bacterium]|nr:amino acid racemase [Paracoccaceae bacterium]
MAAPKRTVGVLGGMGPQATVLLMQKLLNCVKASDDADHIPLIIHQNPGVPSRLVALLDRPDKKDGPDKESAQDPGPVLAQMACDLQAAGAMALAMPCNTAHHFAPAIKAACPLPLLDMLDHSAQVLAAKGAKRIGLLASPAVRLTGVFDTPFAARGLQAVYPQNDAAVLSVIRAIKSGQQGDSATIVAQAGALLKQGCDHILVACTELSLLTGDLPADIPWTDSLDCLTQAIVAFSTAESAKET